MINKPFFNQEGDVFKVTLNSKKECYFKWGKKLNGSYKWINMKVNDLEISQILMMLHGDTKEAAFYHKFNGKEGQSVTQAWFKKDEKWASFKVKAHGIDISKSMSVQEQYVLAKILDHMIVRMNLE